METSPQALDCVSFEPETDCRSNFPNEKAFHSFRRQRDFFYDLFNKWKTDQSHPSFPSISVDPRFRFDSSVAKLFLISQDSSNMYHLSKLLVSQLVQTCIMGGTKESLNNGHPDQFISTIQDDKLRKLRKRLDHGGSAGRPSTFNDEEIFFYDFIVNSRNQAFSNYLKLLLIQRIKETNECVSLYRALDEDMDKIGRGEDNGQIKAHFTTMSLTLQILAKFLGLIEYLPFQTSLTSKSDQFIETQVNLRKDETCCIDVIRFLQEAITKKKLSLTLPWILQFLRQMDPISPQLTSYQKILTFISKIQEDLQNKTIQCEPNIRSHLLHMLDPFIEEYRASIGNGGSAGNDSNENGPAMMVTFDDKIGLIDGDHSSESVITSLQTVSLVVKSPQPKDPKLTTPRKIRPLTLISKEKSSMNLPGDRQNAFQKRLENSGRDFVRELESNFLSLHPISLRRVIELVSERIFSNSVKELKYHVIEQAKESAKAPEFNDNDDTFNYNRKVIVDTIRRECSNFAHDYCKNESAKILPMLLSSRDYSPTAVQYASDVTARKSCERCCQWIIGNINPNWLSTQLKRENKPPVDENLESEELPDISNAFDAVREFVCDLYMKKAKTCSNSLLMTLIKELKTLRLSKALGEKTLKLIDVSIGDLMIALVSNVPGNCDDKIVQSFIGYWRVSDDKLSKFVCPRNVFILTNSPNSDMSWDKFYHLLTNLLNHDVYLLSIFEKDCLWTLENTNRENLRHFTVSLKSIISYQRQLRKDPEAMKCLYKLLDDFDDIDFPRLS